MRALLGIALLVVLLAIVGWVTFSTEPGRASVTVETDKIQQDVDQVSDAVRAAGDEIRDEAADGDTQVEVDADR